MIIPALSLTIAAALLSQTCANPDPNEPCEVVEGWAYQQGEYYAFISVDLDDGRNESIYSAAKFRHEDDPREILPIRTAYNRRVRFCIRHQTGGERDVTILGGLPPRDFAHAVAVERFVDEATGGAAADKHRRGYDDVLVRVGLASPSWTTRQAASGVLARRGAKALGACLRGVRSKDAEVRERTNRVVEEIETGPMD